MEDNKDKQLYILAVLKYKKQHSNLTDDILFSKEWTLNDNYHLKTLIIAEAIKNNLLIEETSSYKKIFLNNDKN